VQLGAALWANIPAAHAGQTSALTREKRPAAHVVHWGDICEENQPAGQASHVDMPPWDW
jgi:hypothetical protein